MQTLFAPRLEKAVEPETPATPAEASVAIAKPMLLGQPGNGDGCDGERKTNHAEYAECDLAKNESKPNGSDFGLPQNAPLSLAAQMKQTFGPHAEEPRGKTFSSLREAMAFPEEFLKEVIDKTIGTTPSGEEYVCRLDDIVSWLEDCSHSSAFTGVGAPETALMLIHRAVQACLPQRVAT